MCCFNKVNVSAILLVHKRIIMHYHLQYETAKDHTVRFYFPATGEGLFRFSVIRIAVTQLDSCIVVIFSCFLWNNYGLDSPGIESRWGLDFSQPSRLALGSTQPPILRVPGLVPGGKAVGTWR